MYLLSYCLQFDSSVHVQGDQLLDIWILREYLQLEMNLHTPKNHSMDLERIIDDFIFICFIAGNDFLPPMPTLDVREVLLARGYYTVIE
jgi:5'-3' exoribonuclease 2